jgi:hypothetical protein
MKRSWIFVLSLLLQAAALAINSLLWIYSGSPVFFIVSVCCFVASLICIGIGVYFKSSANRSNCLTLLLMMINILAYITYLFTTYLGSWISDMK